MGDYLLGIDIGGTKTGLSIGLTDGTIVESSRFPTEGSPEEIIDLISSRLRDMMSRNAVSHPLAIGISCGGPLDSKTGMIMNPPHLHGWNDIGITGILSRRFGIPAFLQNDANACALAEWKWGNGRGFDNVIFLTCGTGLGAGLILDGRLYEGTSGMSGEIGHIRLSEDGPYCYGKRGSIESFCSGAGIGLLYEARTGLRISAKEVFSRAYEGEDDACQVIDTAARKLGSAVAMLLDLLNPQRVIIGSIYSRNEKLLKDRMEEVLESECLAQTFRDCRVVPAALGDDLGDKAALCVAMIGAGEER